MDRDLVETASTPTRLNRRDQNRAFSLVFLRVNLCSDLLYLVIERLNRVGEALDALLSTHSITPKLCRRILGSTLKHEVCTDHPLELIRHRIEHHVARDLEREVILWNEPKQIVRELLHVNRWSFVGNVSARDRKHDLIGH